PGGAEEEKRRGQHRAGKELKEVSGAKFLGEIQERYVAIREGEIWGEEKGRKRLARLAVREQDRLRRAASLESSEEAISNALEVIGEAVREQEVGALGIETEDAAVYAHLVLQHLIWTEHCDCFTKSELKEYEKRMI